MKPDDFQKFCSDLLANDPPEEGYYKEYKVPCGGENCGCSLCTSLDRVRYFATGREKQPLCSFCETHNGKGRGLVEWERACPRVFREGTTKSDTARFPTTWSVVKNWTFTDGLLGKRSLFLTGDTGVCKSRMTFELLRTAVVCERKTLRVFKGGEFKKEIHSRFGNADFGATFAFVDELLKIDVVVFDEFAQEQFAPATFEALWRLVDDRLGNNSPTIFLSNVAPQEVAKFFDAKGDNFAADSMQRRIEEFCTAIEVKEPPKQKPL